MPNDIPLILFPGMGADERLFRPQMAAFENLLVPKWISPEGNETLVSYAKRIAVHVNPGRPCFVGGASFGGFVAMEVAHHLDARACFLIGSARGPGEMPKRIGIFRPIAAVARVVPFGMMARCAGVGLRICGRCFKPNTRSFLNQLADADGRFLRWASMAVLGWRENPEKLKVPVYQIHGDRDHILPWRLTHADVVVKGAGHVLSLTHSAEANAFLKSCMKGVTS